MDTKHRAESPNNYHQISRLRHFAPLSDTSLKWLSQWSNRKSLKKGDYLWHKNDPADFCAVVCSGLIEISNTNQSGEDRIISIFSEGELVGLSAFLRRGVFPANALSAAKNTQIIQFYLPNEGENLPDKAQRELSLWKKKMILAHEQILLDKLEILGSGKLHTKLLKLFENLKTRFSSQQSNNHFSIPIPITKTQIDKLLETRIETVIRTLNKWEKAGYLEMNTSGITLKNIDKLREKTKL